MEFMTDFVKYLDFITKNEYFIPTTSLSLVNNSLDIFNKSFLIKTFHFFSPDFDWLRWLSRPYPSSIRLLLLLPVRGINISIYKIESGVGNVVWGFAKVLVKCLTKNNKYFFCREKLNYNTEVTRRGELWFNFFS